MSRPQSLNLAMMVHTATIDDAAASLKQVVLPGYPKNGQYSRLSPADTTTIDGISYPGGKGHLYQKLINLIPPHRVYIESHSGGGAILRNKRPARLNIAIDIDQEALNSLRYHIATNDDAPAKWQFINGDAVTWLRAFDFQGDEFIYADPPYLMETRRQHRPIYRYEYTTQDHVNLLALLSAMNCEIMISGYWSELYADMLTGWHTARFETHTRGGSPAVEFVWMNYKKPARLHDYRYLGDNYRERERIKRKKTRWAEKWSKMPILERQAILAAMDEVD